MDVLDTNKKRRLSGLSGDNSPRILNAIAGFCAKSETEGRPPIFGGAVLVASLAAQILHVVQLGGLLRVERLERSYICYTPSPQESLGTRGD